MRWRRCAALRQKTRRTPKALKRHSRTRAWAGAALLTGGREAGGGSDPPSAIRASIARMRLNLKNPLRVVSVPVGVGVGLWAAQLITGERPECALFTGGPPAVLCAVPNY